ncbi:hypothetical protein ACT453_43800, partial [Bacillus sp. D-CC]
MASVNTVVKFADKGKLIAEFARSENINDGLNSLTQINTTNRVFIPTLLRFHCNTQTNTQQVTNEQRAMGISGPYSMGNVNTDDVLANSEKVE